MRDYAISGVASSSLLGMRPSDMKRVPLGIPLRDLAPVALGALVCRCNGEWLLRESWDSLTLPGDVIEWYDLPQDRDFFRSLIQVVGLVVSIWTGYGWIAALASVASNVLLPPTAPRAPNRPEGGDVFATGLNGNEARLDQPIWKICGRREITPPFACQPYSEFRAKVGEPDATKDNQQYFNALFAVGIGNHEIVTAKIANTPMTRFADVVVAQYLAPGVQPSFVLGNVTTASEVSSQVLEAGQYVGGFAACAPGRTCAAIGIDVVATRGLGKTGALTVSWRVEYRPINDFGQPLGTWAQLGANQSRTGFTSSPQRWSVKTDLGTPARVEVRVVRLDFQDKDPSALHEIAWTGLRAYLDEPAPLNENCAHFEVVMRASDQLSNIASRDVRLIVKAMCTPLDDTLSTLAEVHTRNPAWWLLDLARSSTWGMSKPDSRVDLRSFYDMAQTCESRQDRFDWVFDSTMGAWDAMQLIARACRSRVFRRNGVLSVARDEIADLPVTAFTPRNCQAGMSVVEKLRRRNSPDGFIVEYQDHRTLEWTPIECPCPGVITMSNPVHLRLSGVTGATHAEREGLYEAANLLYRPRIASWTTEMQGMLPAYMSPVDFLADINGYGHSGDVAFWDEDTLIMGLTDPPDFSQGPLYLTLVRDDGTLTNEVLVTPGPTEFDILLPAAPDFIVVVDDGTRERPKYLLGTKDLVKIAAITDGGKTQDGAQLYNLSALIDDERVHTIDNYLLPGPGDIQDAPSDEIGGGSSGSGVFYQVNLYLVPFGAPGGIGYGTYSLKNDGTLYVDSNNGSVTTDYSYLYTPAYANAYKPNQKKALFQWMAYGPVELAVASLYEVRFTNLGTVFGNQSFVNVVGTFDEWLSLDTDRTLIAYQDLGPNAYSDSIVIRVEIREIATGIIQDSTEIQATGTQPPDNP